MINDRKNTIKLLYNRIQDSEANFVDFRYTDPNGTWHQMTFMKSALDEETLEQGLMIDGSSIPGWKSIENSDMYLKPEISKAGFDHIVGDSFIVICDVYDPETGSPYERDPRSTAQKAEAYMRSTGIADTAYFGPEPEFFIFDQVDYHITPYASHFAIQGQENPSPHSTTPHRPLPGGGYAPCLPTDTAYALRAQMCETLQLMGLEVEKHHHEVATNQHEIGFCFDTLLNTSDLLQICKYTIKNVAEEFGKTATFMAKPILGENGSGMHMHQSLWKDGINLFAGAGYSGLSEIALYYMGGILKHARALNAFTNPTTNSYKRLVPGYEAPVFRAYSARNRSVGIRIPHVPHENARRIEVRFPDPSANPYLALSAMLMAGLDGIENRIHPGEAIEKDLFDATQNPLGADDTLATSLQAALEALHEDHKFLLKGSVFTSSQIESYIKLKMNESTQVHTTPHPLEYALYYRV